MISEERKKELLKHIGVAGYIKVDKLAAKMFTSTSTVRRNLTELEKLGLVRRNHGGVELSGNYTTIPFMSRHLKNSAQKSIIAKKASSFLHENMTVFIDASSTCLHLVPYIEAIKNITVYTNGFELCSLFNDRGIEIRCIGGRMTPVTMSFTGKEAIETAERLYFDAIFFSCSGFSDGIVSDFSDKATQLKLKLLANSKEKYFLCDSTKFGKRSNYTVCTVDDLTEVITDKDYACY